MTIDTIREDGGFGNNSIRELQRKVNELIAAQNAGGSVGPATLYKRDFAFDTPGVADGVELYTPEIGDVLLDVWFAVPDLFDETAFADVGSALLAAGTDNGGLWNWWSSAVTNVDLTGGDVFPGGDINSPGNDAGPGFGYTGGSASLSRHIYIYGLSNGEVTAPEGGGGLDVVGTVNGYFGMPAAHYFTEVDPLLLWVSQDGKKGGDPIESTAGAASVYVFIARPVSF